MVATSIKVQPDTKRLLDELQAELTQASGRKVTLQDLIGALARTGAQDTERLLSVFADKPRSVTNAQLRRLRALRIRSGFPPQGDWDLDDIIYGFPHGMEWPVTPGAKRFAEAMAARKRRPRRPRGQRTPPSGRA